MKKSPLPRDRRINKRGPLHHFDENDEMKRLL